MEQCPHCRARYRGGTECYRCGMDLSLLLQIEERAQAWERIAVKRLASGDLAQAEVAVARALALQRRPLAVALQGFIQQTLGEATYPPP